MVCDRIEVLAYIPLFLAMSVLFVIIMLFEFKSFWMHGNLNFNAEKNLYWTLSGAGPYLLTVLWFIQGIWGLTFIKEACI